MLSPRFSEDDVGTYWIDPDNRVWVVESYCGSPTAGLRCLDNQERKGGAVGALIFQGLERLVRASSQEEEKK